MRRAVEANTRARQDAQEDQAESLERIESQLREMEHKESFRAMQRGELP